MFGLINRGGRCNGKSSLTQPHRRRNTGVSTTACKPQALPLGPYNQKVTQLAQQCSSTHACKRHFTLTLANIN